MPKHGTDLGVDLYELWIVGTRNFPGVAADYRSAIGFTDRAIHNTTRPFFRPSELGGPFGAAYQPWMRLWETIRDILAQTESTLADTAKALLIAVDEYAGADAEAKSELDRLIGRGDVLHGPAMGRIDEL